MMVPAASALATVLLSSAVFFAMSAQPARGIAQFPMYEYIGGFSLTSDVCAIPTAETVIAHATTATSIRLFIFSPSRSFPRTWWRKSMVVRATQVYSYSHRLGGGNHLRSHLGFPAPVFTGFLGLLATQLGCGIGV